jgi:acetate kinase
MSKIMAVNAGSSSLKFQLLQMPEEEVVCSGIFEKIGLPEPTFTLKYDGKKEIENVDIHDHADAVAILLKVLVEKNFVKDLTEIKGVGHRILHCGERFTDSVVMDEEAIKAVESVNDLGPLHNPANLMGVRAFMKVLPGVVNVGVFDTSFHLTMPDESYMYAVPYEWYTKYGIRKYGFHGTSHKYVSQETAKFLNRDITTLRLITCHLGNGASLAAIKYGKCVDTTMGLTPLDGLPMGTRSGTIDPAVVGFISEHEKLTASQVINILNKESGYIGFYKKTSDGREVRQARLNGDKMADLIIRMQEKKIVDYIGSFYAYMGGCDAIVFTAGIGENSPMIRHDVCERLKDAFGVQIDEKKNQIRGEAIELSTKKSKIKVLVIPTNEELMIARDVIRVGGIKELA